MSLFDKVFELPLSRNYVQHWGVAEAVRELLQNALDSDSPLEWSFPEPGVLAITSKLARLEPSTMLLGTTSKAEAKDKIGQFGEGYKIALLVLTREDKPVRVENNEYLWTPAFRNSSTFGVEVLAITQSKYPEGKGQGLRFVIGNLSDAEIEQIKSCTLQMQESIGEVQETSMGQILLDRPGKLYVKGLYVCDTKLWFGYNIKPEFLKLERDRQTVSSFDLEWLVKGMWFESPGRMPQILDLLEKECPDLKYANYDTPEVLKEACYQHFRKEHPGAVVAVNNSEMQQAIKSGMTVFCYTGSYGHILQEDGSLCVSEALAKPVTPAELLQAWFRAHRGEMRTSAIVSFKQLLTEATNWKP